MLQGTVLGGSKKLYAELALLRGNRELKGMDVKVINTKPLALIVTVCFRRPPHPNFQEIPTEPKCSTPQARTARRSHKILPTPWKIHIHNPKHRWVSSTGPFSVHVNLFRV